MLESHAGELILTGFPSYPNGYGVTSVQQGLPAVGADQPAPDAAEGGVPPTRLAQALLVGSNAGPYPTLPMHG